MYGELDSGKVSDLIDINLKDVGTAAEAMIASVDGVDTPRRGHLSRAELDSLILAGRAAGRSLRWVFQAAMAGTTRAGAGGVARAAFPSATEVTQRSSSRVVAAAQWGAAARLVD